MHCLFFHLLLLRIHYVGPHRQLHATLYVIARMKDVAVLEQKDTATLRDHIDALIHVPRVERGRATDEGFLAILAFRVVEIQMQSEVRALGPVRCFVGAVAVRCVVRNWLAKLEDTAYL